MYQIGLLVAMVFVPWCWELGRQTESLSHWLVNHNRGPTPRFCISVHSKDN
jgi:hypothetical protein